jgi:hypothetical protein
MQGVSKPKPKKFKSTKKSNEKSIEKTTKKSNEKSIDEKSIDEKSIEKSPESNLLSNQIDLLNKLGKVLESIKNKKMI